MFEALAVAALLRADPSGDAHGAGELIPPTAAIFSSSAPFDLTDVAVLEGDVLTLRVRLGDLSNPGGLQNGITLPVIDIYLDTEAGGNEELLPGPGLRMPEGRGWNVAVRLTGDRAFARRSGDASAVEHAVSVASDGDALVVATPFAAPERAEIHALTGLYDPFGPQDWRPLAREPSPWSFSSPERSFPVVDVLADDDAAQRAALQSGVLPAGRTRNPAAPWLVLMVLGLVIGAAGLLLRSRVGRYEPAAAVEDQGEAAPEEAPEEAPAEASDAAEASRPAATGWTAEGAGDVVADAGWSLRSDEAVKLGRPRAEADAVRGGSDPPARDSRLEVLDADRVDAELLAADLFELGTEPTADPTAEPTAGGADRGPADDPVEEPADEPDEAPDDAARKHRLVRSDGEGDA